MGNTRRRPKMPQNNPHSPKKQSAEPPTGVKLDPELKGRLERLSELKDRSTHWLMKQAIERYIIIEEHAEALKKETLRRWEEEAELNDTVSNSEVMSWLDTWGEEKDKTKK